MAVPKSIEMRVAGIFTDKVHPYSFFHRNSVTLKNCVGCILSVNIPATLVSILFGTAILTCSCNFQFFSFLDLTGKGRERTDSSLSYVWSQPLHIFWSRKAPPNTSWNT